nr:hypothetical protein [Deltaproteobacteria bacterium]
MTAPSALALGAALLAAAQEFGAPRIAKRALDRLTATHGALNDAMVALAQKKKYGPEVVAADRALDDCWAALSGLLGGWRRLPGAPQAARAGAVYEAVFHDGSRSSSSLCRGVERVRVWLQRLAADDHEKTVVELGGKEFVTRLRAAHKTYGERLITSAGAASDPAIGTRRPQLDAFAQSLRASRARRSLPRAEDDDPPPRSSSATSSSRWSTTAPVRRPRRPIRQRPRRAATRRSPAESPVQRGSLGASGGSGPATTLAIARRSGRHWPRGDGLTCPPVRHPTITSTDSHSTGSGPGRGVPVLRPHPGRRFLTRPPGHDMSLRKRANFRLLLVAGTPLPMAELIWDGKYRADGKRSTPVRVALPFQTVETVNESSS